MAEILAIYTPYVREGTATFEIDPPSLEEMRERRRAVVERGLPYLVAERDGGIVGYAYAGAFRPRPAYLYTVEDSVYIRPGSQRTGAGRLLLTALIEACGRAGMRQVVAAIGDSANGASIGLHASLGFRPVGTLERVGFKFGRWLDLVLMQRDL